MQIEPLIPELDINWPELETGENQNLWTNQWNHHGTCSEDRFDEFNYFSKALELKRNVDILQFLESAGISRPYESSAISEAIVNGTGRRPRLSCSMDNELLEISVCYNLDLAYIDCPPQLLNNPRNKCEVGFTFRFPSDSNMNGTDHQRRDEL